MHEKKCAVILISAIILTSQIVNSAFIPFSSSLDDSINEIATTSFLQDDTYYWIIDDEVILDHEEIIVLQFIIIESTGRLVVNSTNLIFEMPPDRSVGIRVMNGGQLVIHNSQVDSVDYSFWNISALPGSSIDIYNSSFQDSHIGSVGPQVSINNASCSILHSTFRSASDTLLHLLNLTILDLNDCDIRDSFSSGMIVEHCSNLMIDEMRIRNTEGYAVEVRECRDIILSNITAMYSLGILIQESEYIELKHSDIHVSSESGVSVSRSDFVNLYNLTITETNQAVITVQRSSGIILNESRCETSRMSGNQISSYMATHLIICRNNFSSSSGNGGMSLGGTSHCIIAHNLFYTQMSFNFGPDSGNNSFDFGGYGNYWSNYRGMDQNGDGIGDSPFNPNENVIDNYPLMTPDIPNWVLIPIVLMVRPSQQNDATPNSDTTEPLPSDTPSVSFFNEMTPFWVIVIGIEIVITCFILRRRKI